MNILRLLLASVFIANCTMAAGENRDKFVFAFLALKDSKVAALKEIEKSLIGILGKDAAVEDLELEDGTISFKHGGNICIIGHIDKPIPWQDLEGPCTTSWWWEDATKEMKNHKSHFIITVMGEEGSRLEKAVALSKYIAAAATCHNSAGIYWGDGTLVHEPAKFIEIAKAITPDDFPTNLWVDIRFWKNEKGEASFATTGLDAFGKLEIEVINSQKGFDEIYSLVSGAAKLQLLGSVFKDGDTIGPDDETKVKTSHEKSVWDRPEKVLRIHF